MSRIEYPVDRVIGGVAASLAANRCVVLQSPPGSGKTTRVPPALLDAPWLAGRKILMLEPRRLAARSAAAYMARQRGERVGDTIGYRIRLDNQTGPHTRIEILTEGMLAQRLIHDPEIQDTGLIIFDEFHERNLAADFGLALALDVRNALRLDLRLMVMSATLDPVPVAEHLNRADIHTAEARLYPVETRYLHRPATAPIPAVAAEAVARAVREESGDVLVFLPGEGEIRSAYEMLSEARLPPEVTVFPLYGALDRGEQDRAIAPSPPGHRKVVLATSIAESSLTIEGIRVVVDTGWMRVPRFSPRTGMSRLETLRITRDRADQRRGRAGRLGPGVCYRLWDESTDRQLEPESQPEILDADLASTVLQCAEWGCCDRLGLPWLTSPPDSAWRQAVELLEELKALSRSTGRASPALTPLGKKLAALPLHPRLGYAVERACRAGCGETACWLAAVISESPSLGFLRRETDLRRVSDYLLAHPHHPVSQRAGRLKAQWAGVTGAKDRAAVSEGVILAWAFPDRVAKRRNNAAGTYLMRCGRGAVLDTDDPLLREEWLVAVELQDGSADAKIRLAVPITREEVLENFGGDCKSTREVFWDNSTQSVQAVRRQRLGYLVLSEGNDPHPESEQVAAALCAGIRGKGVGQLPWSKGALALRDRVEFLRRTLPADGWPDFSDAALADNLESWLMPFCFGVTKWSQLEKVDLTASLLAVLDASGKSRAKLDAAAPTHVTVPSGSRIPIRYSGEAPHLEVRIQEVFGMSETPKVANGKVPVVMHLLSPAQRPVQVTSDLKSFWSVGYALVRKDLRGRYPKHYWPEDPTQAVATNRVRPRMD